MGRSLIWCQRNRMVRNLMMLLIMCVVVLVAELRQIT
jgi:hypothetical protein